MARRVARICLQVLGPNAGPMSEALTWAGTFHAIRAKLLREYAGQIGLDPGFTIHDREDSADLMNLIRHELGFSKTESRFPTKGTCLAVYSRAVNAEMPLDDVLCDHFPWCAGWRSSRHRTSDVPRWHSGPSDGCGRTQHFVHECRGRLVHSDWHRLCVPIQCGL
jgi:superfamily I DNA/RNA helicase